MEIQEQINHLQAEISKCLQVLNLENEPGWAVIQDQVSTVKNTVTDAILVELDPAKIIRLQERYRAFNSIATILDDFRDLLTKSQEELAAIQLDAQIQQEYNPQ